MSLLPFVRLTHSIVKKKGKKAGFSAFLLFSSCHFTEGSGYDGNSFPFSGFWAVLVILLNTALTGLAAGITTYHNNNRSKDLGKDGQNVAVATLAML